ncbi:alpha/beta-hydrolase [Flagelloscypha sp. PMI_526]|nr:alpha/beta-hydrolase [Flagelloscypha sp. PMI_526]
MSVIKLTYTHIQTFPLSVELLLPETVKSGPLPVLLFFHGGGLLSGSRNDELFGCPSAIREPCFERGIIFAKVDYPLLWPFTAKDIVSSIRQLWSFLGSAATSSHLPEGSSLDMTRIAVAGYSGGAYPCRIAALHASPKPVAVLSAYGQGGDFLNLNDFWFGNHPFSFPEAVKAADGRSLLQATGPSIDDPFVILPTKGITNPRWLLFLWMGLNGVYLDYFTGINGLSDQLRALKTREEREAKIIDLGLLELFPEIRLEAASEFPPTFLFHGSDDAIVLVGESERTYTSLQQAGAEVKLVVVPDTAHGMIDPKTGLLFEGRDKLYRESFDFLANKLLN